MTVPPTRRFRRLALALSCALLSPAAVAGSLLQLHELATQNDPQFQADFYGKQVTDERY